MHLIITHMCTPCSLQPTVKFPKSKHDLSERTTELDGTIAGAVLGALFALITMIGAMAQKKCLAVSFAIISRTTLFRGPLLTLVLVVMSCAVLGAFYRYKTNTLDTAHEAEGLGKFKWYIGYGVAILSMLFNLITVVATACMKKASEYGYIQIA